MKSLLKHRNSRIFWTLAVILAGIVFLSRPGSAQLQQSGGPGSSVTVTSGTITATQGTGANLHVDVDSAPTTAVTGTFWQTTQPVSMATAPALVASTAMIGYTRPQNACSTTNYESVMSNPPTSSTSLTATTTCVTVIYVSNTTASAATLTLQDQGTGCNSAACIWVDAFSVPANSNMILPLYGAKFASGIKWSQGTANALSVDILGNQ